MLQADTPLMGRGAVLIVVCVLLLGGALVMGPWQRGRGETERAMESANLVAEAASRAGGPASRSGEEADGSGLPAAVSEPPPGASRSLRLGATRVELPLPDGYELAEAEEAPDDAAAAVADDACTEDYDYCVYAPTANGAESAGLTVRLRYDLESEADCVLEPLAGFEDNLPSVSGSSDHAAARFGTVARPAGDEVVTTSLRRLSYRGVCLEFVARVVTAAGERADAARQELAAIVDGVRLPDGRSGLWSGRR